MSSIRVQTNGKTQEFSFENGDSLLSVLRDKGFGINAPCGGNGLCGKCRVLLRRNGKEEEVLACRTILEGNCEVILPEEESSIDWNGALRTQPFEPGRTGYGIAVDLGTTTVAVSLYDFENGRNLGTESRWNAQKAYGADVISRIGYCMEHKDGLSRLSDFIRSQILDMTRKLCGKNGLSLSDVTEGYLAGNTVMEHVFAGIAPDSIAASPYRPLSLFDREEPVLVENIPFSISPCIAGYVGGDITAGLLAGGADETEKTVLFIDVGTNGEIVLKKEEGYTACAVASGPAFEGAGIACGMNASEGAVSRVELTDDGLSYEVIGGGEAKGICGSGLLDLVACLLDCGIIDESGCMETESFFLTDSVFLTQGDVRQLQLAKAAVSAGIRRLLETEGIGPGDIGEIWLSGGFGTRLRSESAIRIGMLPAECGNRVRALGNTSLSGASLVLLNPSRKNELLKMKERCKYLELSSDAAFNDRFVEEMSFPEE